MALLDVVNNPSDSTGIVERATGANGTVLDIDLDVLADGVVELVLTGGSGPGEVSYVFQS